MAAAVPAAALGNHNVTPMADMCCSAGSGQAGPSVVQKAAAAHRIPAAASPGAIDKPGASNVA